MPLVESVEKAIRNVEGFDVRFRFQGPGRSKGRDVRSDRADIPQYRYVRACPGTDTVAAWRDRRFAKCFPGYSVEVLDGSGRPVDGRTLLRNVRSTYH